MWRLTGIVVAGLLLALIAGLIALSAHNRALELDDSLRRSTDYTEYRVTNEAALSEKELYDKKIREYFTPVEANVYVIGKPGGGVGFAVDGMPLGRAVYLQQLKAERDRQQSRSR